MILAAELDANGWVMIIGALFLGAGQIVQMVIAWRRELKKIEREDAANQLIAKVAQKQDIATEKVAEVAIKQDEATKKVAEVAEKAEVAQTKSAAMHQVLFQETAQQTVMLDAIKQTAEKTAAFVNGATTTQLQVTADALRQLANKTHEPKDIHAADAAEEFLKRHIENQPKTEGSEES